MVLPVTHRRVCGVYNILGSHWRWSYQLLTVVFVECKIVEKSVYIQRCIQGMYSGV